MKQRAISLLESMLVLCLAAVIILIAARQYTKYTQEKNIQTLNNSVQTLLADLKSYYASSSDGCQAIYNAYKNGGSWQSPISPSVQDLKDGGYLDSTAQIQNPFNPSDGDKGINSFALKIDPSEFPFKISVTVTYASNINDEQAQAIAAEVNPTSMSLNSRYWQWSIVPSYSTEYTGSSSSTLDTSLQYFAIQQMTVQEKTENLGTLNSGNIPCSAIETYIHRQVN